MRNKIMTASVLVLAVVAPGAAGAAGAAGPAAADTAPITVQYADNDSASNGLFDVALSSTSPIASIQATLFSVTAQQDAATVTKFSLKSGTTTNGVWVPSSRIKLTDLGDYRIDLVVTDTAGDTLTDTGAGDYFYEVWTKFRNMALSTRTVDITNDQVTMSGQLVGIWPGSGAATPLDGYTVFLSNSFVEDNQVTTGVNGDFSGVETVTQTGVLQAIYSYDNNHSWYIFGSSAEFLIRVRQSATRLVVTANPKLIPFNGGTSISGILLWDSPSGWLPLANEQVGATGCGLLAQQMTTDANGDFSAPVAGPLTGDCTIQAGWQSDDPFKKNAATSVPVTVVQPDSFSHFVAKLLSTGQVLAKGHMQFPNDVPAPVLVSIQFEPTRTSGWTTVATGLTANWDGTGYAFRGRITSPGAGYWRAIFRDRPHFADATSAVVYVPA